MLRGFVRDAFEHRLSNAYKIGDTVKTKSSGNVVVVDMLSATKILVRFVDSGFEKFVTTRNLQNGAVRDDSKLKYKRFSVGDLIDTCNYGKIEILSIPSSTEATVRFVETGYVVKTRPCDLLKAEIKDPTSDRFKPKLKTGDRFCVYLHKDISDVVRYVGQGIASRAFVFTGRSSSWGSLFSVDNPPTVEIVENNLNKDQALSLEFELITKHKDTVVNSIKSEHSRKEMLFEDFNRHFKYDESSPTFLLRKTKEGGWVTAGFKTCKYYKVSLNNSSYAVHRVVWLLHSGSIDKHMVIDHIDNNPANNHISNLRMVSYSDNSKNRLHKFPESGFRNIMKEVDRFGNVTGYKVTWWRPNHDRKSSKLFSVSKHGDSLSSTLRAAYLFREGLIERGELLDKIKQGEASID